MVDYWQLLFLGGIAGLTIYLGLPLATLQNMSSNKKGLLNAVAIGILIFLIVDVLGHAWEAASDEAVSVSTGGATMTAATIDLLGLFVGMGIGLLGLVWYESRYMTTLTSSSPRRPAEARVFNADNDDQRQQRVLRGEEADFAYKLSTMIAVGIGVHNFSEGLAIGQSYTSGAISLAVLLIIGFGAHNATEGFGIAGPLTGLSQKPSAKFLALMGLIGGGPTFLGTVVGSMWTSTFTYVLFLSIAGGALVYVAMLMYNTGRMQTRNNVLMIGIFLGLTAGFVTDLIVTLGGA